ncbi:MAG: hypothetical protein IPO61_22265 [Gammaproteobacteria bacterium]|nr:hypothetical protein [Gammaproteobacteria bacterium]
MRPTSLRRGDRVRVTDERGSAVLEFVRREHSEFERSPVCYFSDVRGVPFSAPDAYVARRCERVQPEYHPRE